MKLTSYLKRKAINAFTRVYDPLITINIGKETLRLPLSHSLREIMELHPDFNFNLPRIISYCEKKYKNLSVIDIGANIGDTVVFIRNYSNAPVLCIDGENRYLKLLAKNTQHFDNISVCRALVGNENKTEKLSLKMHAGTAHLEEGNQEVELRTLENILDEYPDFQESKVLKSDTDGFDTLILRSSADYLLRVKPILFFEFDPHYISKNNDDPFDFLRFLKKVGYRYLVFFMSVGDYLVSLDLEMEMEQADELVHYFSGRQVLLYADICAFTEEDKDLYDYTRKAEIAHYRRLRNY